MQRECKQLPKLTYHYHYRIFVILEIHLAFNFLGKY